jgi:peroxiredoxin Q/BCP
MRINIINIITAVSFLGWIFNLNAKPLEIGDKVPPTQAIDHEGNPFPLNETLSSGTTLIFFYPKADTPGCTAQACSLRDQFKSFEKLNIKIIGVSRDTPKTQAEFRRKYNLTFPLLADEKGTVTKAFGVPSFLGFNKRVSYLVRDGKIIWRDYNPRTDLHAQDVLQALETIGK